MEIIKGKYAGFCPGVENTINKTNIELEKGTIYCLGEIIHNEEVIEELEKKGMKTIENLDEIEDNSRVIFRAHGEAKKRYEEAKERNIEVIDLTCGKVKAIHIIVERQLNDSFIIVIGKKKHPEVIGTIGFCGDNSLTIENEEDIDMDLINNNPKEKIYIVAQTTFSSEKFDYLVKIIKSKTNKKVVVNKTICDTTELRQKEVKELSKDVNQVIVIGGKNSSNTKELANIAKENNDNVILVQTEEDLKNEQISNDKILLVAGASTPKTTIDRIEKYIKGELYEK